VDAARLIVSAYVPSVLTLEVDDAIVEARGRVVRETLLLAVVRTPNMCPLNAAPNIDCSPFRSSTVMVAAPSALWATLTDPPEAFATVAYELRPPGMVAVYDDVPVGIETMSVPLI
jgi:hypothetical protein